MMMKWNQRATAWQRMVCRAILLTALVFGATADAATKQPKELRLTPAGEVVTARPELLGHNMAAIDWQGTSDKRGPILWDIKDAKPDPAWTPLTHAFPLRLMRFHWGNFYPWKDAVGPVGERKKIKAVEPWVQHYREEAGFNEFMAWIESLPEKPQVSLIVSPFRPVQELVDLVAYCNAVEGPGAELRAQHGHPEPYGVKVWELGNESDWVKRKDLDLGRADTEGEKQNRLPVADYIRLCEERIDAMRQVDASIQIYAHAATAPWPEQNPQWREWHREVIPQLGAKVDGIVLHPYYDGYPVAKVMESVEALIADIKALQPAGRDLKIWLSEHARWIDPGRRENWPQSWGLTGAISTADFLLRCMQRGEISMANYWCYAHHGPWRVIDADWKTGATRKFGTGMQPLFALLNAALLPQYQLLRTENMAGEESREGITAGLFLDAQTGRRALVVVNRSGDQDFSLHYATERVGGLFNARKLVVSGESLLATNTPETPAAVSLTETSIALSADTRGQLRFELPARSVTAWIWEEPAGVTPAPVGGVASQPQGTETAAVTRAVEPWTAALDAQWRERVRAAGGVVAPRPREIVDDAVLIPDRDPAKERLKGLRRLSPGALDPDSVVIRRGEIQYRVGRDGDVLLDAMWGGLGLAPQSRLDEKTEVLISYRVNQRQIDALVREQSGREVMRRGVPQQINPELPALKEGDTLLAHVFLDYRTDATNAVILPVLVSHSEITTATTGPERLPRVVGKLNRGEAVKIVCWGDSVTEGRDQAPGEAYPQQLAAALEKRFPRVTVASIAVGGSHSRQWLSDALPPAQRHVPRQAECRFQRILDTAPDLVVIEFVNDQYMSQTDARQHYAGIAERLREAGIETLLLTPHRPWERDDTLRARDQRGLVLALRELGHTGEPGVGLADGAGRWEQLWQQGVPFPALLTNGFNHPDGRGHRLFTEEICRALGVSL